MGTLSAGKQRGPDGECGRLRLHLDHHLLMAQKLDAGPAMLPPTPVPPEKWCFSDHKWMRASRSPGAAFSWRHLAIGTAHAADRDDNCEC